MNKNPKDTIKEFLTVCGYEDDKDLFADDLLATCHQKALIGTLKQLPTEKRKELEQKISTQTNEDQILDVVKDYVQPEVYRQNLQNATEIIFADYVLTILPSLKSEQKTAVQKYLNNVSLPPT
ncbi:hypothetical protein A2165_00130 [Candidatus Curtissbacteria bacterium RBG_13_40_7]|uniref:Uncharacterized protein n=1 Tax=Candidatus Curtissbacteria bacterium RBG_13_40_7 TaxID=1797706 RepID=A0A1F5FXN6_9BACT|nr:MAG: hypothetical protein A2165_00130 [Candidatus Curtissbacteria bacterium RBG_13_40_7]